MTFWETLQWLLKGPNKHFTGLLEDPRAQYEKNRDYAHEERSLPAVPVDPFSNPQLSKSPYFYENQQQTSSCVPHGVGLALAIERKADLDEYTRISQMYVYRQRSNYPQEGSYPQEIFDRYRHKGSCLYTSLPTPTYESQANSIVITQQQTIEAQIYKGLTYFTVKDNYNDIATLASIAQQGHGVAVVIYATFDEWARQYPLILTPNLSQNAAEVRHCVCILPQSGFTLNGKRYVAVQDSAWFGGWQLRYVSEDFIKARVTFAGYWDKVVPLSKGPVPKFSFTRNLKVGDKGSDVKALQQLFVSQGLLPAGMDTGVFGGYTLAGLHAFQSKFAADILIPNGLTAPTDIFGPASRAKANQLCG